MIKNSENLTNYAKSLRKNMTKEERHLWYDYLKDYPIKFYRQRVIGKYIVDFYCFKAKLVVELDGSQHYEEAGRKRDMERDSYLESKGIQVLRIQNTDINKILKGHVCI